MRQIGGAASGAKIVAQIMRLIYYSRNCITGSPREINDAVMQLLLQARTSNASLGLTGALMFNMACFAQVLEGPADSIQLTYKKIASDRRHDRLELLARGSVSKRFFPHWSMAFVGGSAEQRDRFAGIGQATGFDPTNLSGDALLNALLTLVAGSQVPPAAAAAAATMPAHDADDGVAIT